MRKLIYLSVLLATTLQLAACVVVPARPVRVEPAYPVYRARWY